MNEDKGRREIPIQDGPAPQPEETDGATREPKVVHGAAAAKAYQQQAEQGTGEPAPHAPAETPAAAPAAVEPEELRALETKLKEAESRVDELNDQLVRSVAEFDNFRKRTERERVAVAGRAAAALMRDLLPVVDHLTLALQNGAASPDALHAGVALIQRQLQEALGKHGLEEIPALGQHFNPAVHEALMSQPSAEHEEGTVLQVLQSGYTLAGAVLRPARVIVAAAPQETEAAGQDAPDNA